MQAHRSQIEPASVNMAAAAWQQTQVDSARIAHAPVQSWSSGNSQQRTQRQMRPMPSWSSLYWVRWGEIAGWGESVWGGEGRRRMMVRR